MASIETKTQNIVIRQMEPRDIDRVIRIDEQVSQGGRVISSSDILYTGTGGSLDYSFVAEVDGRIAGFALSRLAYLGVPFDEVCVIHVIAVEPKYQKLSLARQLVNSIIDKCYIERVHRVRLLIEGHNISLQHFAEHLGFQRSPVINYDKTLSNY